MAISAPRARAWIPAAIPKRVFLLGMAAAVAAGGSYVAIAGNPLIRGQSAPTYQTATVSQGTLQVTVTEASASSSRAGSSSSSGNVFGFGPPGGGGNNNNNRPGGPGGPNSQGGPAPGPPGGP